MSKKAIHKQVIDQVFDKKGAAVWLTSGFNTKNIF